MKVIGLAFLGLLVVANIFIFGIGGSISADYVITNSKIQSSHRYNSIAIKDGKIQLISNEKEMYKLIGKETKVFDGKNQAYIHPIIAKTKAEFLLLKKPVRFENIKMGMDATFVLINSPLSKELKDENILFMIQSGKVID
jgi:hypothetical protein